MVNKNKISVQSVVVHIYISSSQNIPWIGGKFKATISYLVCPQILNMTNTLSIFGVLFLFQILDESPNTYD